MKTLETLDDFIAYCEATKPEEWCTDVVRSKDLKQNCMFGHLVNWWFGPDYKGSIMDVWDGFEELWATTFMVYPVNDGENPKYQQPTAKERVIAYLKDLNSGKEKNTRDLWREFSQKHGATVHGV